MNQPSRTPTPLPRRILLAAVIGMAAGALAYAFLARPEGGGDFFFVWKSVRSLFAGHNPYHIAPRGPENPAGDPLQYPLPALLIVAPFAWLPLPVAGGLFLGVGSIFFIVYNGALIGAVGGFLTERGLGATFYAFVATHSSFELIAIVLSGAAGLRLGQALVAPGRLTRRASLVQATRDTTPLIYGFTILLLIAAAVEAFWSSAPWIPPLVKYPVAAACWIGLLAYLLLQGRRAR